MSQKQREQGEIKFWFTTKTGRHIPVYEGESKAEAVERFKKRLGEKGAKREFEAHAKARERKKRAEEENREYKFRGPKVNKVKVNRANDDDHVTDVDELNRRREEARKLNDEESYRDAIKHGDAVTNKDGKMTFKGKEIPELDTKDAGFIDIKNEKGEVTGREKDSLNVHLDADGKLDPERQEVHRQILERMLAGKKPFAPEDEKVAYFTGGGGASGKGQFVGHEGKNVEKFYSKNTRPLLIDPDELKKELAKADGRVLDDKLTGYYHEESSALAKQAYATALQHNFPVLYDGTATGGGVYKLLESAKKSGYRTEMNFIASDPETVIMNALDRYESQGRLVPLDQLLGAHRKAPDAIAKLSTTVDDFTLFDNSGRKLRKVGDGGKDKEFKVLNTDSYKRISTSSKSFELSADAIDAYNARVDAITKKRKRKAEK